MVYGALLIVGLCGHAGAQRVLVETTAVSALREAAGVYLHTADLSRQEALPGSVAAPGPARQGELLPTPDGQAVVLSSGAPFALQAPMSGSGRTYLSAYAAAPLHALPEAALDFPEGWRQVPGAFVGIGNRLELAMLVSRVDETGAWQGRLDMRPFRDGVGSIAATYPLPGAPEACAVLNGRVAVLCRGSYGGGAIVHVRDIATGAVVGEFAVDHPETDRWSAVPSGIQVSPDGRYLYVLVSGYAADRPGGDAASWLFRYAVPGFRLAGEPQQLPGTAEVESHPLVATESGCWVATRAPSSGFAYATHAISAPEGLAVDVQMPYFGVSRPIHIAPAPMGPAVAVAVERRIEVWPIGKFTGPSVVFEDPVETLRWMAEGLFAGEGNRIHFIDPNSAQAVRSVSFNSGLVTGCIALSPWLTPQDEDGDGLTSAQEAIARTNPAVADTDRDGILDGLDPEPLTMSPRLTVPPVAVFHGESAGQEMRAVRIDPAYGPDTVWRVAVDSAQAPWLSAYPRQGKAGEAFYMGVDPTRYPVDSGLLQAFVTVYASGTRPELSAAGSPATIRVEVVPPPGEVPDILWLLDPETVGRSKTPGGLNGLSTLLAMPPLRFKHVDDSTGPAGNLSSYRVVVLTAEAVARGRVTRQDVLDYTAAGGAVLLLGGPVSKENSGVLEQWLAPLGIYFDPNAGLDGVFATASRDWLCRNWSAFEVREGAGLRTDDTENVLVPGPTGSGLAVLVAVPNGRGRVAVLASPTPLENGALGRAENRRFAGDLFRWLARIGTEYQDSDGDGIPDRVEDANENGMRDPGETDRFLADSDGDALPDGVEDANRNGKVDEGETSPLNADSDGDFRPDGADVEPLPPAEAPHVEKVEPGEGPAEGGNVLFVTGRNFGPGSMLWVGDRPALGLRRFGATAMAAEAPPAANDGGDVDVRVLDTASGLVGVLPGGYRYAPRSSVRLVLSGLRSAQDQYSGSLTVRLETPPDVRVGRVSFRVEATPQGAVRWSDIVPGVASEAAGRRVESRPDPSGGICIDISPAARPSGGGELVRLNWQASVPVAPSSLRVSLEGIRIAAPNGQPLDAPAVPAKVL
jgi:hypothetical protein